MMGRVVLGRFAVCACALLTVRLSAYAKAGSGSIEVGKAAVVWGGQTGKTDEGRRWMSAALADLVRVIEKTTGHRPETYEEGTEPRDLEQVIYFGDTSAARAEGVRPEELRNRDWRIKAVPGKLFLYGKTGMASSYAMTSFAENCCKYLFVSPEGDDPCAFDPGLVIPVGEVTIRPAIYRSMIWNGMKDWGDFKRRRRAEFTDEIEGEWKVSWATVNFGGRPRQCHTTFCYLPPERYFKDHPEWYSYQDGVRKPVQLCYSSDGALHECLEVLRGYIRSDRAGKSGGWPVMYDFTQQDGNNGEPLCQCEECAKTVAACNRKTGGFCEGGSAGLQLKFANRLANEIAKEYPDVQLRVFAYCATETPPRPGTIVPAPNVNVWWCDLFNRSDHTRPLISGPYNFEQADRLKEWLKLTRNISVWDYMIDILNTHCPEWSPDAISADMRFYRDNGIQRLYEEMSRDDQFPMAFYELNFYLCSLCMINPDTDVDRAADRYCRIYGKGGEKMREALGLLRKLERDYPTADGHEFIRREFKWRTLANWRRLHALVAEAYKTEDPGAARGRIAHVLACFEREIGRLLALESRVSPEFEDAVKAYGRHAREYVETMPELKRGSLLEEVRDVESRFNSFFKTLPDELRGAARDTMECLDHHVILGSDKSRTVNDPDAERGKSRVWRLGGSEVDHKGFPFKVGIFCRKSGIGVTREIEAGDAEFSDGRYHWLRIGRFRLEPGTCFWAPDDWNISAELGDLFVGPDDGPDRNCYDAYVSVKVTGPAYFPGTDKPNGIWVDRLVLHRITNQ